jgi:hypothetical protein
VLFVTVWDASGNPALRETDDVRIDRGALLTSVVTASNNKECPSDCKQVETLPNRR